MANKFLDKNGLINLMTQINIKLGRKIDRVNGKGLSTNDFTDTDKNKLNNIANGAEVNQNAFTFVTVGENTIRADSKTDTFKIANGDNITVSASNDTVTIGVSGLGSAAFKNINEFDTAGAASTVLGTESDDKSVNTVYGAKSAAADALSVANTAKTTADAAMPKSGGTFTGGITLNADPTTNLHAATKQYVDSKVAGITGAMHFKGIVETIPTALTNYANGDVILIGTKEYVLYDNEWYELGDETSFVLKTQKINNHALTSDITLTSSDVGADASGTASTLINGLTHSTSGSGNYVSNVTQSNGKVTVTKSTLPTTLPNTYSLNVKNVSNSTTKSYNGSSEINITAADFGAITNHQDISHKQDTLSWISNEDIDSMFAGTYGT